LSGDKTTYHQAILTKPSLPNLPLLSPLATGRSFIAITQLQKLLYHRKKAELGDPLPLIFKQAVLKAALILIICASFNKTDGRSGNPRARPFQDVHVKGAQ